MNYQMETKATGRIQTLMDKKLIKVLLVEDDAVDKRSVEQLLAKCSQSVEFTVESVGTLSADVECLADKGYDIAVLDPRLPDSGGVEAVRKLSVANPHLPVVVLTGSDDEETGLLAIKSGAADCLVKSQLLENVLVRTILYALERQKEKKLMLDVKEQIIHAAKEWRTTFDSITDLISIHDKNFKIRRVNKALANTFGKEPKELIGKTCYELFHGTKEPA